MNTYDNENAQAPNANDFLGGNYLKKEDIDGPITATVTRRCLVIPPLGWPATSCYRNRVYGLPKAVDQSEKMDFSDERPNRAIARNSEQTNEARDTENAQASFVECKRLPRS